MTDLEITKLCAEAMGYKRLIGYMIDGVSHLDIDDAGSRRFEYDPLHDDAQAMALVKQSNVHLVPPWKGDKNPGWEAFIEIENENAANVFSMHPDLNRAICECVAKMQLSKASR